MAERALEASLAPLVRAQWIVRGALLASVLIYVPVVYVVTPAEDLPELPELPELPAVLGPVLTGVAVLAGLAGVWVTVRTYSSERLQAVARRPLDLEKLAMVPGAGGSPAAQRDRIAALEATDQKRYQVVHNAFGRLVTTLVLFEVVALMGLVQALLSGNPSTVLPFVGGSVILMLTAVPRHRALIERIRPSIE